MIREGSRRRTDAVGRASVRLAGGFSLVELLVVIAVIGVLAAISLSVIGRIEREARITATAFNLKLFGQAFTQYLAYYGSYPPDTHNALPTGIGLEKFLPQATFETDTPMGGRYNWEGPDTYPYAGISLTGTTASVGELQSLDDHFDDGNLFTGSFRRTPNGRYTYIIDESP